MEGHEVRVALLARGARIADQLEVAAGVGTLSPFEKVVAIVAYDEPTEPQPQYAPYTLEVNGVTQAGGGG